MIFWFVTVCVSIVAVMLVIAVRAEMRFRADCRSWKEKHAAIHHDVRIPK